MWIPKDVDEIEQAIASGTLEETASFEAKAQLPDKKKNADMATDVAAMATDGGVIVYGIGEDENKQLTISSPIPLAGAADRISQVVSTSIAEVPHIEIREYPTAADASLGYMLVIVPQSARAPHQVTVKDDLRFYGRDARGNRRLSEGDIARLYERRQRWEVDREQILNTVIAHAPIKPRAKFGYIHAFTRPVAKDAGILERARTNSGDFLKLLLSTVRTTKLTDSYAPSLESAVHLRRHGGDEWRWSNLSDDEMHTAASQQGTPWDPTDVSTMAFNLDGRGHLFCGRATDTLRRGGGRIILEGVIAGNVEAFFAVMHAIYDAAGYHGHLDIGVALTGLTGASSEVNRIQRMHGQVYPTDAYTRTERIAAGEMAQPAEVAQRLLRHFFEATTGYDTYDAWK